MKYLKHGKAWWLAFFAGWGMWIVFVYYVDLSVGAATLFLFICLVHNQLGRVEERERIEWLANQSVIEEPKLR